MSRSPRLALLLVAAWALSPAAPASGAAPGGAPPRRVLCLSDLPADESWLMALEEGLNESPTPFVVIRRAVTGGDEDLLGRLLAAYSPAFVVSRRALSGSARRRIEARGIPHLVLAAPGAAAPGGARGTARRILAAAGGGLPSSDASPEERLAALRARARAHLESSSDSAAESLLQKVHDLAPGDPEVLLELIRLRRLDRPWAAIAAADRLAALPGRSGEQRADALLIGAALRARVGDSAAAQRDYRSVLELRPGSAEALLGLAKELRESPSEALVYAARAVDAAPREPEAHRVVAEIRLDLGDHAAATRSLQRALDLAPDDLDSLSLMVRALGGRPSAAAVHAERALAIAEKAPRWYRPDAYRLCARMRQDLGDHAQAVLLYKRALAIDPEDLNALQDLARLNQERPREAVRLLEGVAEREPSSDDLSEAALLEALEADPDELDALSQLLSIRLEQGRLLEASALARRFHESVLEAPSWMHSSAYRLLTRLAWEAGDPARAWRAARERDWWALDEARLGMRPVGGALEYASAEVRVAEVRAELGDDSGAERRLRRVLELFPDDLHALAALLELKASRGGFSEALSVAGRLERASARSAPWKRAEASYRTAQIRLALNDEAGAERSFKAALGYFPDDLHSLQGLLRLLTSRRRFGEALPYAERLEKSGARSPSRERAAAWAQKAQIQLALGDEPGAERSLVQALSLLPEGPALPMLLDLTMSQRRFAEALPHAERLEKTLAGAPPGERAAAFEKKARIQLALGDEAGAEKTLRESLSLSPEGSASPMLLRLTMSQRRFAEALPYAERLEKAAAQAPPRERAAILAQKAQIQLELKDEAGAEKGLVQALALSPEGPALTMLLHLMMTQRRFAEALSLVERLEKAGAREAADVRAAVSVQKAQILLELKEEAGAEKSLVRALSLLPEGPALPMLLDLLASQRRFAEALPYAERLEKAGLRSPPRERAAVCVLKARIQLELKDEAGAERSLLRALDLSPEGPALAMTLDLMLSQRRFAEALAYAERLEKAGASAPSGERAQAFARKALIQLELKDEPGAERSLREALDLLPEGPALPRLIDLMVSQRRFAEALPLAERLGKAGAGAPAGERAAAWARKARIQLELKDEPGAEKSLEQALALASDDLESLWTLFEVKSREPRAALLAVSSRKPAAARDEAAWLALRGHAHALNRDDGGARRDLAAAVALDPQGVCFGALFDRRRSRLDPRYFDQCLARFPSSPALRSDRGVALYLAGRPDEAMEDFRKAVELEPANLAAHMNILSLLAGQGRVAEALAAADAAVAAAKDPASPILVEIRKVRDSLGAGK